MKMKDHDQQLNILFGRFRNRLKVFSEDPLHVMREWSFVNIALVFLIIFVIIFQFMELI